MDSKRIVITGATSGVGKTLALSLSHASHKLILVARRENILNEVAQECIKNGAAAAVSIPCDITKDEDIERVVEAVKKLDNGEIVLVNGAGIFTQTNFVDQAPDNIRSTIDTNLLGPVLMTRYLLPLMLADHKGQIVNILSIAADQLFPDTTVYGTTKAGLFHFSKGLSLEVREKGIRVVSVLPGAIDTPMLNSRNDKLPTDELLTPQIIADTIIELIMLPKDRVIEFLRITPPGAILHTE